MRPGCGRVEELVIEVPLVLPGPGRGAGPGDGRAPPMRRAAVRWRCTPGPRSAAPDAPWTRHAAGMLAAAGAAAGRGRRAGARGRRPGRSRWTWTGSTRRWPAPGWRTGRRSGGCGRHGGAGEEVFAEVALPEGHAGGGVRGASGAAGRGAARDRPGWRGGRGGRAAAAVRLGATWRCTRRARRRRGCGSPRPRPGTACR